MDMIAAYNDLGSYRGAAAICGVDHKTVKRVVAAALEEGDEVAIEVEYGKVSSAPGRVGGLAGIVRV